MRRVKILLPPPLPSFSISLRWISYFSFSWLEVSTANARFAIQSQESICVFLLGCAAVDLCSLETGWAQNYTIFHQKALNDPMSKYLIAVPNLSGNKFLYSSQFLQ